MSNSPRDPPPSQRLDVLIVMSDNLSGLNKDMSVLLGWLDFKTHECYKMSHNIPIYDSYGVEKVAYRQIKDTLNSQFNFKTLNPNRFDI